MRIEGRKIRQPGTANALKRQIEGEIGEIYNSPQ